MAKVPDTGRANNSAISARSTRASDQPTPGETGNGQEPDWDEYLGRKRLSVQEAVALSLSIRLDWNESYEGMPPPDTDTGLRAEFDRRVRQAHSHIQDRSLSAAKRPRDFDDAFVVPDIWEVEVDSFRKFAVMKGWPLPARFPQGPEAPTTSWPWGMYTTKLLGQLASAAAEFWATKYEPGIPATAPTSEEVAGWLVSRGVAKRVAEVMAQILRADDVPPGPHNNR